MSDQISSITRAGASDLDEAQRERMAAQPGALTERPNDVWQFTGDGNITPSQVAGRVMELSANGDSEMTEAAKNDNVRAAIAQQNINHPSNTRLAGTGLTPDTAIPSGEPFMLQGGASLKTLVQTIMRNPQFMEQLMQGAQAGSATSGDATSAEKKAIGMVRTQGRTLPLGDV